MNKKSPTYTVTSIVNTGDDLRFSNRQLRLYICLILPNVLGLITVIANFSPIHALVKSINKPPLTLPTFLLVLFWIALYTALGYASYLIWDTRAFRDDKQKALVFCVGQLLLHSLWVSCFFKYHWFFFAFLLHVGFLALAFGNMMLYRQLHKQAGTIMIIYFAFCAYFTYLNFIVIFIN